MKDRCLSVLILIVLPVIAILIIYCDFRHEHTEKIESTIVSSHSSIERYMITFCEEATIENQMESMQYLHDIDVRLEFSERFCWIYESNYFAGTGKLDEYLALLSAAHIYLDVVEESIFDASMSAEDMQNAKADIREIAELFEEIRVSDKETFWKQTVGLEEKINERAENNESDIWDNYLMLIEQLKK